MNVIFVIVGIVISFVIGIIVGLSHEVGPDDK